MDEPVMRLRASELEDSGDVGVNPTENGTMGEVIAARFNRRDLLRGTMAVTAVAAVGATFSSETSKNGWFGMPDNCAVDSQGRLWISTDGNNQKLTGRNDGLWALETDGQLRGTSRHFFRVPAGAELCGPFFTPNDESLFLAVQHPGEADEGQSATSGPYL